MDVRQLTLDATGKIIRASLPKGHLNGVLCTINIPDSANLNDLKPLLHEGVINAKFVYDETEHLNANTPLNAMVAMSDINFGSIGSVSRALQTGQLLANESQITADQSQSSDLSNPKNVSVSYPFMDGSVTFYIDYGSIYCDDGNEFSIEFDLGSELPEGWTMSIYSCSRAKTPFLMKTYSHDVDLNEEHKNIIDAWVYSETLDRKATVFVEADSQQYDVDLAGMRAATQTFGQIENVAVGVLTKCFTAQFGVPEDVWVRIVKKGSVSLQSPDSRLMVIATRVTFPEKLVKRAHVNTLYDNIKAVNAFERKHPAQAMSMYLSGLLIPSSTLQKQLTDVNKSIYPNASGMQQDAFGFAVKK